MKQIAKRGGIAMCAKVLESHPEDAAACRHATSLLRNMSASDKSKDANQTQDECYAAPERTVTARNRVNA